MEHPVVHFEILGPDGAALQKYYADLFGWQIDSNNPANYGIVTPIAPGIGGGVSPSQDGKPSSGLNQPPKKNTAVRPAIRIMLAYSARKNKANAMPEYST